MLEVEIHKNVPDNYFDFRNHTSRMVRCVGCVFDPILRSTIFNIITLNYFHVFIHELGHAVACRMVSGGTATIHLHTSHLYAYTQLPFDREVGDIGSCWILVSGPLAGILFSAVLAVGIFALTHYVPMPYPLSLVLKIVVAGCAGIRILGELFYAVASACNKEGGGDFGHIARLGTIPLLVCMILLLSVIAATGYAWYRFV